MEPEPFTKDEQKKLDRLKRRRNYLALMDPSTLNSWDRGELASLNWVIDLVERFKTGENHEEAEARSD